MTWNALFHVSGMDRLRRVERFALCVHSRAGNVRCCLLLLFILIMTCWLKAVNKDLRVGKHFEVGDLLLHSPSRSIMCVAKNLTLEATNNIAQ